MSRGCGRAVVRLTANPSLRAERIRRGRALFVGDAADAVANLMPRDPVRHQPDFANS